MYKVKVDEKLLCFTGSVNGMEYVTDPDVKLVVNGVDSFSFAIYPQHPLYKKIVCKVSRVKIWRDSKLLFYGEVTGYSRDMYGIRTYDCEGALAWLNDLHFAYSISGATPKDVLYWYIKMYNQKLRDKSKSFELGTVTVHKAMTQDGTEGTIARSSGVYPSFWEEIQDKLLNSFGGILRVRYVGSDTCAGYIDWLAIPDGTCAQDVRYAKNLLNCDWTYDCTSIAIAVVPLGKRKDSSGDNEVRLTIDKADDDDATFMIQYMTGTDDLVKSGNMVYSKSRMEKYGLIQQAVTFDDVTDTGTLAYQGAVWLRQNGKASSTISAEAIDLADIDESVEHFTLGDYVRTKLPGDSAESLFPITAIKIPIAAPENAKLTVGTQESGITSGSGGQGGGSIADAGSGADAMAHTHSNKGVLDKITEQDYADFKASANKAHVHDNKSTLDKIDETSWLLVYGQTHDHENQPVLDKTTASYTAAEKTKLAGIAAGAEVNQNAFSTIATGSARYAATAKQSAFLIDGDGGTLVSLDPKTGRLTVSSHTHDNKAVLDQLSEEQWKFINGAANKAHVHDNKGALDKITDVVWNTVYGYTHSHDNKSVLDKTTASYTAADKKKLDGMDLSKYAALSHTHTDLDTVGSVGYYGNNSPNAAGWYKIYTGTITGYDNNVATLLIEDGYNGNKVGLFYFKFRCNNSKIISVQAFDWLIRRGFAADSIGVVTGNNEYSIYLYCNSVQWGRVKVRVLESQKTQRNLTMFLTSNTVKESIEPSFTRRSSDMGIVAEAQSLTDSGWITPTTTGTASSTLRYRKQGKIVCVSGYVTVSASTASIAPFTLPEGYRPSQDIKIAQAVDSSSQDTYIVTIYANGKVLYVGKKQGFFATGYSYYMHVTYFID